MKKDKVVKPQARPSRKGQVQLVIKHLMKEYKSTLDALN